MSTIVKSDTKLTGKSLGKAGNFTGLVNAIDRIDPVVAYQLFGTGVPVINADNGTSTQDIDGDEVLDGGLNDFANGNSTVAKLLDLTANGYNLSSSNLPLAHDGTSVVTKNGTPYLDFDRSDDNVRNDSISASTPFTMFGIIKTPDTLGVGDDFDEIVTFKGISGSNSGQLAIDTSAGEIQIIVPGFTHNTGYLPSADTLISFIAILRDDPGATEFYVDGTQEYSGVGGSALVNRINLNSEINLGGFGGIGVHTFGLWDDEITATERSNLFEIAENEAGL